MNKKNTPKLCIINVCSSVVRVGVTPSLSSVFVVDMIVLTVAFCNNFQRAGLRYEPFCTSYLSDINFMLGSDSTGIHFRCLLCLLFCLTSFTPYFISFNESFDPIFFSHCTFLFAYLIRQLLPPNPPSLEKFSVTLSFLRFTLLILPPPPLPYLLLCARPNAVSVFRARH